jgi:hypothetical protein
VKQIKQSVDKLEESTDSLCSSIGKHDNQSERSLFARPTKGWSCCLISLRPPWSVAGYVRTKCTVSSTKRRVDNLETARANLPERHTRHLLVSQKNI